tara:strand:- start:18 stop:242 length:225 start_codon:yes stop_codon:yes gene_type:complete
MSKKTSYMDSKNILSEGLLQKIADFILKGKMRKLVKKFKSDPKVIDAFKRIDKNYDFLEKRFKERGIDIKNPRL